MKNVIEIIRAHGGMEALAREPIRIDRPCKALMPLTVEAVGDGPRGGLLVAVSHWCGDVMRDPEMVLEAPRGDLWSNGLLWEPVSLAQHPGARQVAAFRLGDEVLVRTKMSQSLRRFMRTWDENIMEQGYLEQYNRQHAAGARHRDRLS